MPVIAQNKKGELEMAMLIDNQKMMEAKSDIDKAAVDFASMGSSFIKSLTSALSTFEGETKDILMKNQIGSSGSETDGTLAYFVEKQIPDLVKGLSQLLEGNRTTIDESDHKLAEAISGGGQS